MPKPLPSTLADLRVPNPRFAYLADATRHRFRPTAASFELVNAWWLAEVSYLIYLREKERVWSHLERAGFDAASFVAESGIHAAVVHDERTVLVVFRGTDVTDLRNVMDDAAIRLRSSGGPGRVHTGFRRALDAVWGPLAERIHRVAPGRRVWLTGHSLGGALATLATARLDADAPGCVQGLYTFGSPRVGDAAFADAFPCRRAIRVVYEHDIVAELPPPVGGYRHIGDLHHLRRDGGFAPGTSAWERFVDNVTVRLPEIVRNARTPRALADALMRENALADHSPAQYAVRLWNLYESTLP